MSLSREHWDALRELHSCLTELWLLTDPALPLIHGDAAWPGIFRSRLLALKAKVDKLAQRATAAIPATGGTAPHVGREGDHLAGAPDLPA